jgi:hypothetical protein
MSKTEATNSETAASTNGSASSGTETSSAATTEAATTNSSAATASTTSNSATTDGAQPSQAASGDVLLKKEVPSMSPPVASEPASDSAAATTQTASESPSTTTTNTADTAATPAADAAKTDAAGGAETAKTDSTSTDTKADATSGDSKTETASGDGDNKKVLQGYIRVVPVGTKVPIIMDTAVDSDTSQEGDEFAARTSEDLSIDGTVVVPAGSIIKGRIASLNAPKHLNRCGSVAMKFDTVTTPDNRQIPLVANLVARGGVVHARRGLRDYAIDTGIVSAPILAGLLIGYLAGSSNSTTSNGTTTTSSSHITRPEGAMIGAGVGLALGVAILMAKKGKKVDVRPGDELKIELAEELRMPMM